MHLRSIVLVPVLALIAGCGPGREYRAPSTQMPAHWHGVVAVGQPVSLSTWWTAFNDPALDRLVDATVQSNIDLQRAVARLDQARALRREALWALAPEGGASAAVTRSRTSSNLGSAPGQVDTIYQGGFDASWEVDLFGGLRRSVEAATADAGALEAARGVVLTTVVAETVRTYVDLVAANELLSVTRADLDERGRARDLIAARVDAGTVTRFDLLRVKAQLASRSILVPELERRRVNALTRLAVLLARPAGEVLDAAGDGSQLIGQADRVPTVPAAIGMFPAGVPLDLVRARPDVRQAERVLAGAVARVGVAEHDLYPRLSLTGAFGLASDSSAGIDQAGSRFWVIGPVLRWPILNLPRIRSRIAAAEAGAHDAELAYRQAVLVAAAEVEDALSALLRAQERDAAVGAALSAHEQAHLLAQERFAAGAEDLLAVLTEQHAVTEARQQLVEARREVALQVAALAKALGGGWNAASAPQPHG